MKQRYQSPAWISGAMDDAGLTPHEFRVLAHVCRRAGDGSNGRGCDASVPGMAEVCGMKAETLRGCLQRLAAAGWLVAETRPGKPTEYRPGFPPERAESMPDPSPETVGVPTDPSPQKGVHPSRMGVGDPSRLRGGKGNPEGKPLREPTEDTDYPAARCGTSPPPAAGATAPHADSRGSDRQERNAIGSGIVTLSKYVPEIFEDDARAWARQIHASEGKSADSTLAMFPPEEVETWAVDWLVTMQARGWLLDGTPVANPRAALRGYLRKAANGRSRRFKEVSRPAVADTDEAFIESLKSNPAYAGICIEDEIGKMAAWLSTKPGQQLTRRFAVNWLNRCETPLSAAVRPKHYTEHHLGYRTMSRVNAADLPNLPDDYNDDDIPF